MMYHTYVVTYPKIMNDHTSLSLSLDMVGVPHTAHLHSTGTIDVPIIIGMLVKFGSYNF